jgi:hypothetical protein
MAMTLTPDRLHLSHQHFLADHPEVVAVLHSITQRHAQAAGLSLEAFQQEELERAIAREARAKRLSPAQLLAGYLAARP